MTDELSEPEKRLRSVTTVFAGQVQPGPVEIETRVLRRGRAMSQVTATLRSAGADPGHTSVASFGSQRAGFQFTDLVLPTVPVPDECPSFHDGPPDGVVDDFAWRRGTFMNNVEWRLALGHFPWDHWVPTTSEHASWMRFAEPPINSAGVLDPLAVVALCDMTVGAVRERVGPGQARWIAPSPDLTVHVLGEATSGWLLAHRHAHHAGDGYASTELKLWDPAKGIVAFATQMLIFSFLDGTSPSEVSSSDIA
jgi:hypothetical protein